MLSKIGFRQHSGSSSVNGVPKLALACKKYSSLGVLINQQKVAITPRSASVRHIGFNVSYYSFLAMSSKLIISFLIYSTIVDLMAF